MPLLIDRIDSSRELTECRLQIILQQRPIMLLSEQLSIWVNIAPLKISLLKKYWNKVEKHAPMTDIDSAAVDHWAR